MKYTIHGFSQEVATTFKKTTIDKNGKEKEIKIDCTDLLLLRWLVDFYPKMIKIEIEGMQYAWLQYQKILEDLPLLDIKKQALYDRLQKLCDFGILKHKTIKAGGTYSYYGFGAMYSSLIDTQDSQLHTGMYSTNEGVCSQLHTGHYLTNEQINKSIKDVSIKNNSFIKNTDITVSEKTAIDYQAVVDAYNIHCTDLPKIKALTDKRKRAIKARCKNYSLEDFITVFKKAQASDFLSGRSGKWNGANFDWLINESNMVKVLEGNYDNKQQTNPFTANKDYSGGWE